MGICRHWGAIVSRQGDVYCTLCTDQNRSEGSKKFETRLKAKEPMRMVILCEVCHKRMDYCPNNKRYACNDCRILEDASGAIPRASLEDPVDISRKPAKVNKYPKGESKHELDVIQRLSEEYRRIQKYEQIQRIETAA